MESDFIQNYIKMLADSHSLIKQFYFGDYDKILSAERSSIEYPCLWYESPEIDFSKSDSDNIVSMLSNSFTILVNSPSDDEKRIRYNKALCERIAKQIVLRMLCDGEPEGIDFNIAKVSMFPLDNQNNDNDQGWRVNFSIETSMELDMTGVFNSVFPNGIKAHFNWSFNDENEELNLINDESLNSDDLQLEWEVLINNTAIVFNESTSSVPAQLDDSFYCQLNIKKDGKTISCSSHSLKLTEGASGSSFPFVYNPFV